MRNYEVFLFDFDGTLFDTYESSIYVFEEAYRRKGMNINREEILGFTREPIPVSYKRVTGSLDGYDDFMVDIDELVFSDKVTQMAMLYEDTLPTLTKLKKEGKKIGIVTSNSKEHVLDVLRLHKMDHLFDVIVGNKEAEGLKPDPGPVLAALKLLGNPSKEKVVYVGDSLNDARAALNAEVNPVLLDRLNEFSNYKQYKLIRSLDELL